MSNPQDNFNFNDLNFNIDFSLNVKPFYLDEEPPVAAIDPTQSPPSQSQTTSLTNCNSDQNISVKSKTSSDKDIGGGGGGAIKENSHKNSTNTEKRKPKSDTVKSSKVKETSVAVVSKAKKEDIEEDPREIVNMVFIGHVDAGKSTIGGHLLLLTGQVDKRTMEKYERDAKEKNRESWYLSWALDTNAEERDKGKTVEVGKAYLETKNKRVVLLDAPGHKGFVPNMISGAAQADIAILVISARKGEFETGFERGGQTREHALIAKTAGTKFLVVLVNKMDDSTVEWDQNRYSEIETKLTPYLKKVGFKNSDIFYMPCSGFTGHNLKERLDPKICSWYSGPSLLEYIDELPQINNKLDDPPMILISDRYKDVGTVVIGKIMSGYLAKGDSFVMVPVKKNTKITTVLSLEDEEKAVAKVGEHVKLRLTNIEEEDIPLGSILCTPNNLCETSAMLDCQLMILDCKNIICPGHQFVMHLHNAVEEVNLVKIHHTVDRKTGSKNPGNAPRFIKQDQVCVARLRIANATCMAAFSDNPELGRFTLRDEGRTCAVGKIVKVLHPKVKPTQ